MKQHMLGRAIGGISAFLLCAITHAEMPYKIEYPEQSIVPISKIQVLRTGGGQAPSLSVYTAVVDVRDQGKNYTVEHFEETIQADRFEASLDVPKIQPKRTIVPISKTEITRTKMRGTEGRASETKQIDAWGVEVDDNHNYTIKEFKMEQDTTFNRQGQRGSVTHIETKTGGYADQDVIIIREAPEDDD